MFGLPPEFAPWLRGLAGRERWLLYVATDGDTPVATGALFLLDVGGERFAELDFASTLPDHRGRGAQSALIARRVADARALGARWIATEVAGARGRSGDPVRWERASGALPPLDGVLDRMVDSVFAGIELPGVGVASELTSRR